MHESVELVKRSGREGNLLFSYRLDEESWSSWSNERTLRRTYGRQPYSSSDGWWNEDPSPALLTFNIEESFDDEEDILPQADCSVCSNIKKLDPSSIFLFCSLLIWFTQRRIEIREPDVI